MSEAVSQTLVWVNDELAATFQEARQALEDYIERPEQSALLTRCAERMHEATGALMMVEVQGAALLAEEVELVARAMLKEHPDPQSRNEGLDALTRAMVQLPSYMERVISGGQDIPLVLLPLLNDLRAVRGQPLLSENTLLLLNLPADRRIDLARQPHSPPSGVDIRVLGRELRPRFQSALLGWIRSERPDSNLAVMADVTGALEEASAEDRCYQLWWVAGGVIEALRQEGLESTAAVKRMLGQVDRQIRRVIQEGETRFESSPPVALLNSLLFYVARSTSRGRRVSAIRQCFSLGELLPAEEEVEGARDSLSGPSVKLMQTVGTAIREDLTRVKDVLDIFVRTGMERVDDLLPQLDLLKKIGDTLGVLGSASLQDIVQQQADRMKQIATGETEADEESLLAIAKRLIEVEDTIESQLVGLITEGRDGQPEAEDIEEAESTRAFRDVTAAVLRECNVNIGRVKEAIVQSLEAPLEPQVLDEVPRYLRGVTAGLLMLDRTRAVQIVERIDQGIKRWLAVGDAVPLPEALDHLAEAIVSLEYYMETIESGRSDPMYMLDNAEACLGSLDSLGRGTEFPAEAPVEMAETLMVPGLREVPTRLPPVEVEAEAEPLDRETEAPAEVTEIQPPPLRIGPEVGHIDPELLELFIEEAGELAEIMNSRFPAWAQDPSDQASLSEIRRQFHTLKGSGRMVGAELIGEFGWSLENLLNRLISGTAQRSDALVTFVGKAVGIVPALVEQLETGQAPSEDVADYIAQAQAFAESRPDAEENFDRVFGAAPGEPAETPVAVEEMDPVLRDIFTKEATGHLEAIRAYLEACRDKAAPHSVTEEFYRACHTLSGSANMAGVTPAVTVAAALNQLVRRLYEDGEGLPEEVMPLCERSADVVGAIIDAVSEGRKPDMEVEDLAAALSHHHSEYVLRAEATAEEEAAAEEVVAPEHEPEVVEQAVTPPEEFAIDPEIAAIFREEATEILDHCDGIIQAWRADRSSTVLLEELQRQLHTLKGGARLAGLLVIGDLSHELETLVSDLAGGHVPATDDACELVQRSLDELHRMRVEVTAGEVMPAATELAAELAEKAMGKEEVEEEVEETIEEIPREVVGEELVPEAEEVIEIPPAVAAHLPPVAASPESSITVAVEPVPEAPPITTPEELPVELPEAEFLPPPASAAELWAVERPEPVQTVVEKPAKELPPETPPEIPPETPPEIPPETPPEIPPETPPEIPPEMPPEIPPEMPPEIPPEMPVEIPPEMPVEVPPAPPPEIAAESPEMPVTSPAMAARHEIARVDAALLEDLLNSAGEVSIFRSRLEQQLGSIDFNLDELAQTVVRLRDQLRKLEMETEAQILHGHHVRSPQRHDFDPLEMDRYSVIQQLSRGLAETASDVSSLQHVLVDLSRDAETLLTQQSRVISELQDGLMRTRMVPFSRHAQRLNRIVRQAAHEEGKQAELHISGGTNELDRQVMDGMLPPIEHLLRNAVIHGIEKTELRHARGKPDVGRIGISLRREGAEMAIEISDDGAGLDFEAIRRRAELMDLIEQGQPLSEDAAFELILKPGFSTAAQLTQSAGRGVGMDVVATEVREAGGSLRIDSTSGEGTRLLIRLPYTRAITQALIVRCGEELFALPLPTVEGIVRIPASELESHLGEKAKPYEYGGREYRFRHLAALVDSQAEPLPEGDVNVPVILVRAGEQSTALLGDEMLGAREIVVKTLGPQFSTITGVSGATILGDGSIVIILDAGALVRAHPHAEVPFPVAEFAETRDDRTFVMVVDDSITVRRVTERLLERNGMRVITAKDGVDAVALLRDHRPDIILLDIEMPRMDGYEVAGHIRNDPQLRDIPIIMVTSRVGEKHRARAIETGVDDYLGKPYQENQLLGAIESLIGQRESESRDG